jgi:hypothetical protein
MSTHKPPPHLKPKPDLDITPAVKNQTQKIVIFLTEQLAKKIDESAIDMFGERKGNISLYVEQAMRIHEHMTLEGVKEI